VGAPSFQRVPIAVTGIEIDTAQGTVPKSGHFACAKCGTLQRIVESVALTEKTAPSAVFAVQAYSPELAKTDNPYGGRYFTYGVPASQFSLADQEWEERKSTDLKGYWPESEIPFGHMTHQRQPLPQHGFLKWEHMFNSRQLLIHSQLLTALLSRGECDWSVREYVLGAFQQYLRNQCLFSFWNPQRDTPEPMSSNNNYHPNATFVSPRESSAKAVSAVNRM